MMRAPGLDYRRRKTAAPDPLVDRPAPGRCTSWESTKFQPWRAAREINNGVLAQAPERSSGLDTELAGK